MCGTRKKQAAMACMRESTCSSMRPVVRASGKASASVKQATAADWRVSACTGGSRACGSSRA